MLTRCHWLAAIGSQGNPLNNHVRVHSIKIQAPASPKTPTIRSSAPRPSSLGINHHAAKYHEPTHTPTTGPSSPNPSHDTWCNQPRMIVHATALAPSIVHA